MAVYSIKDLEKLSGIKAHTIRVWEQRYGIVVPQRTKANIRYYQDKDLKVLINVALLNKRGVKISRIAKMSDSEIAEKANHVVSNSFDHSAQLDTLTLSMIEIDECKFESIISSNIKELGFEYTMLRVIYPFLDKLSLLWLTGSITPAQENFMSYLIRQKIIAAIDALPTVPQKTSPKFLLYLPENETQELGLLFMYYLLKSRQNQVIYIGLNMTLNDLKDVYLTQKPNFIYTIITETFVRQPVQCYVNALIKQCTGAHILLSGYQIIAQNVMPSAHTTILKSLEQTIDFLDNLRNAKSSNDIL